jgi:hypothetical protein
VLGTKAAGDALDENLGVGFDEDRHDKIYDFGFTIYNFKTVLFAGRVFL